MSVYLFIYFLLVYSCKLLHFFPPFLMIFVLFNYILVIELLEFSGNYRLFGET